MVQNGEEESAEAAGTIKWCKMLKEKAQKLLVC
jgi:hypothetical protein